MITAMAATANQASIRRRTGIDHMKEQCGKAAADARMPEVVVVAPQDPDALPGRGRWAECY